MKIGSEPNYTKVAKWGSKIDEVIGAFNTALSENRRPDDQSNPPPPNPDTPLPNDNNSLPLAVLNKIRELLASETEPYVKKVYQEVKKMKTTDGITLKTVEKLKESEQFTGSLKESIEKKSYPRAQIIAAIREKKDNAKPEEKAQLERQKKELEQKLAGRGLSSDERKGQELELDDIRRLLEENEKKRKKLLGEKKIIQFPRKMTAKQIWLLV